jgi:hypothetical protein
MQKLKCLQNDDLIRSKRQEDVLPSLSWKLTLQQHDFIPPVVVTAAPAVVVVANDDTCRCCCCCYCC